MTNFRYIEAVGVELEGGWKRDKFTHPKYAKVVGHDGSVNVDSKKYQIGEIKSPPMDRIDSLCRFIDKFYPDAVNKSCGFHIHVSLREDGYYSGLMNRSFQKFILKRFTRWGKKHQIPESHSFWERLEGKNSYCKAAFIPDKQVGELNKGENRYTQFNFCFGLHGTLEFRMLPQFESAKLATSATKSFVRWVEAYLSNKKNRQAPIQHKLKQKDVSKMLLASLNGGT